MAESDHPSSSELADFLVAREDPGSTDRVRKHLETGCVRCVLQLHRQQASNLLKIERMALGRLLPRVLSKDAHDRRRRLAAIAERRVFLVEAERLIAPGLLRELLQIGTMEERHEAIRTTLRFRVFGLAELLTDQTRRVCFKDVAQAVELGRLAAEVTDALDRRVYPRGLAADAAALAWTALGNALRVRGDLVEAERALERAQSLLEHGSQDRTARAEVLSVLGSLRTDQARFDDAVEVLETAAEIHHTDGDAELEAKVLVKLGNAAGERGEVERAVGFLSLARARLRSEHAPGELQLIAAQAQAGWLQHAGRVPEARSVLEEIDMEASHTPLTPFLRQRIDWARARQAWLEGDIAEAAKALQEVRERYAERNEVYRMCLVTLDLALLYLEQGRIAETRELAREMLPVFSSRQLHHNVLQALVLFHRAAAAERATVELVEDVARYLRRAQNNPYLPYLPKKGPSE